MWPEKHAFSLAIRVRFRLWCGARLENRDAGLDYECCFYPGRPTQAVVRCLLRGGLILAFLRALVGAFKAVKLSWRKTLVSAGVYGM